MSKILIHDSIIKLTNLIHYINTIENYSKIFATKKLKIEKDNEIETHLMMIMKVV
jgi:hypothetical protein